jgi:hypothetical protein
LGQLLHCLAKNRHRLNTGVQQYNIQMWTVKCIWDFHYFVIKKTSTHPYSPLCIFSQILKYLPTYYTPSNVIGGKFHISMVWYCMCNFLDCRNMLFQGERTDQMWNTEPISMGFFCNFVTLQYVSGFLHALLLLKFLSCLSWGPPITLANENSTMFFYYWSTF